MPWRQIPSGLTPALLQLIARAQQDRRPHPIFDQSRQGPMSLAAYLDAASLRAARDITEACAVEPEHSEVLNHAGAVLPASLFSALVMVCGGRIGMEAVERSMGWPSRSAKLVIALALQELIRQGVV